MKYNPNLHHRRSIRLKEYDYSQAGSYFITICCQDKLYRFGKIENNNIILNEYGTIAYNEWIKLPQRFTNLELDVFQIMPNHMHAIIVLNNSTVGAGLAPAPNYIDDTKYNEIPFCPGNIINEYFFDPNNNDTLQTFRAGASPAPTVGGIIGAYKSLVANNCLDIFKIQNKADVYMGKLWQRNYYEHIIRNEQSYQTIACYIINNPAKWKDDKFYIE